jgi:RNA polymerase sigma-70 factor (ECF subfamily)
MSEEEFNEAVRLNFHDLVRTASSVLRCEAAAEDAVQQTLVRVWKNIEAFDPKRGSIEALLHVAVKRQALDHLTSLKRRIAVMEGFWGEYITGERPKRDDPRMNRLIAALGKLPDKPRSLIQKRFFEGKAVAVIANEVGLSKSATQARIRRAEGALRRLARKEPL